MPFFTCSNEETFFVRHTKEPVFVPWGFFIQFEMLSSWLNEWIIKWIIHVLHLEKRERGRKEKRKHDNEKKRKHNNAASLSKPGCTELMKEKSVIAVHPGVLIYWRDVILWAADSFHLLVSASVLQGHVVLDKWFKIFSHLSELLM